MMDDDSDVMYTDPGSYGDSIFFDHGTDYGTGTGDAVTGTEDDFEVVDGPE